MTLTAAQNLLIKNAINADPVLSLFPASHPDSAYAIADAFNLIAVPDFIVWKVRLHEQEITSLTSAENTVWSWPAFIARTPEEQTGWARMFNGTYAVDPSLSQVRVGFADVFSGTPNNAPAQRTHLLAISKEKATRIEKLLATGTGSVADPATRVFVGPISPTQIEEARK